MTFCAKHGSANGDRLVAFAGLTGSSFTKIGVITDGIHRQSPSNWTQLGFPTGITSGAPIGRDDQRNSTPWRTGGEEK